MYSAESPARVRGVAWHPNFEGTPMVIAISAATHDECKRKLGDIGAAAPKGRSYHSTSGPLEAPMVFDTWQRSAVTCIASDPTAT